MLLGGSCVTPCSTGCSTHDVPHGRVCHTAGCATPRYRLLCGLCSGGEACALAVLCGGVAKLYAIYT